MMERDMHILQQRCTPNERIAANLLATTEGALSIAFSNYVSNSGLVAWDVIISHLIGVIHGESVSQRRPFLESQHYWQDFHATFVPLWRGALNHALPSNYEARIDEQMEIVDIESHRTQKFKRGVSVIRNSAPKRSRGSREETAVATMESVTIPFPVMKEVKERWIKILHRAVVAVLELLSPSNKRNPGRGQYLRSQIFMDDVHLEEVDLLLGVCGCRWGKPLPPADFYALVARSSQRPNAHVYAWSIRNRLPVIPIPLLGNDKDITVDLQKVSDRAYDSGTYERSIDYSAELKLSLSAANKKWAEQMGAAAARK
jgi:hypothetical protein